MEWLSGLAVSPKHSTNPPCASFNSSSIHFHRAILNCIPLSHNLLLAKLLGFGRKRLDITELRRETSTIYIYSATCVDKYLNHFKQYIIILYMQVLIPKRQQYTLRIMQSGPCRIERISIMEPRGLCTPVHMHRVAAPPQ